MTRFKNMLYDLEFKFIFSHEEILKDFINSYFKYIGEEKEFGFSKIVSENYIMPDKREVKGYFSDITATLTNGDMLILESYTSFDDNSFGKSYNYMSRLYSNQITKNSTSYRNRKKIICLYIMSGNYQKKNKEIVNKYTSPRNDNNYELLNGGELEFVLVRFDLVNKKCYDENEDRFIRWLRIMSADNLNSMKKYSEGDERMQESIKFLEWYATSELNHGFEDILREKEYIAEEKGLQKGIKEEKIANAKNFLGMGVPVDIVVRGTGLSLDEVLKIKKELNKNSY